MEEKSNNGGGNWEAEHAIGAYDDLIINTKEETLTITMFELLKIEHALEHQHSSNFESDHEMLHEEINKAECDWEWAVHLCLKMKEADDAFKLIEKIKERTNGEKKKSEDQRQVKDR